MTIWEWAASGGGFVVLILSLLQITPIKVNPWSAIARGIGRAINAELETKIDETRSVLDKHIADDNERNADRHRARILRFNLELIRSLPHTREDYIDVLAEIDQYEHYCNTHPEYRNNRAVCAIENIKSTYQRRMEKHDFLQC